MDKRKKYLSLCISLITLSFFCLTGCGKEKTTGEESYSVNEVTAMRVNADTWNTDIMVSADENIHIHFDGSISNGEEKPSTSLQNGILSVTQQGNSEGLQDQISLGKKGQITIYLPSECNIPLTLENGMGDIEIDSISTQEFSLNNSSGYATISSVTADNMKISSGSGDITIKQGSADEIKIETSSGYVQINETVLNHAEVTTKSGETTISKVKPETNLTIQSGSGDINLTYQSKPESLEFAVTSGSKDITTNFDGATYSRETSESRQGVIGKGEFSLKVNSDSGTVVIK